MLQNLYRTVDPKVLGQRLQAARDSIHFTQQDVAQKLGIARTTLVAIENGTRLPKPDELHQLALVYHRSIHNLLRQQVPVERLIVQFRASRRVGSKLDQETADKIGEFERLCEDYVELERKQQYPLPLSQAPVYSIDEMRPDRSGEDVAAAERNRLGLGDAPILNLRELLENEGVRIFLLKLPSRVGGFFGYTEQLGPCMAINAQHPPERRQWSLAHEYAHFLTKRHEVDLTTSVYSPYEHVPKNERFAEAFARAFLMPAASVSRRFHEMRRDRGKFLPADLCLLASYFRVSIEAMARRLEDLQLIRGGKYDSMLANGFRPNEAREQLGLVADLPEEHPLPLRYRYLATEALAHGNITEADFVHYLRTDWAHARQMFQSLRTRPVTAASGEDGAIEFSLTENMGA